MKASMLLLLHSLDATRMYLSLQTDCDRRGNVIEVFISKISEKDSSRISRPRICVPFVGGVSVPRKSLRVHLGPSRKRRQNGTALERSLGRGPCATTKPPWSHFVSRFGRPRREAPKVKLRISVPLVGGLKVLRSRLYSEKQICAAL